jgi:[ribosomal protein S5]-alanine N-acetyltransferase
VRPSEESHPSSNRRIRHANGPSWLHREGLEVHDAPARHANDRRILPNLRDAFPHPYGLANAEASIAMATTMSPITFFAVAVGDKAVGGIGYTLHQDVERVSAEIGYWLGAAFWGRGIMTSAVDAVTRHAFAQHEDLRRIYAVRTPGAPLRCECLKKWAISWKGGCGKAPSRTAKSSTRRCLEDRQALEGLRWRNRGVKSNLLGRARESRRVGAT